nr:glycosyltransferase [Paenibacillus xylanexedens]
MYKTSIVINASIHDHEYVAALIENIRRFTERGTYELIVVEHSCNYKLKEWLSEQTDILTLFNENILAESQVWNKGIEVASGNNILLMHSDTLVTEYWLDYMLQSLYQNENIAAVGPVSNKAHDIQKVNVEYGSMEEMLQYGRECNRNFGLKQKITLEGFCILFKKNVVDITGSFHDDLSGHQMMMDYCLRIREANYRFMVCTNVFVHHYGLEKEESYSSSGEFKARWGFDGLPIANYHEMINEFVSYDESDDIRVLVVGSGSGDILLHLHNALPNAKIYGTETNLEAQRISNSINNSLITTLDSLHDCEVESFDYIILNTTNNIKHSLEISKKLMKQNGNLAVFLPNSRHYSVVLDLISGKELSSHQINDWSLKSLTSVLNSLEFNLYDVLSINEAITTEGQALIRQLGNYVSGLTPEIVNTKYFIILAKKVDSFDVLHDQFNQLFRNTNIEVLETILKNNPDFILKAVKTYDGPVTALLNYLAISYYEQDQIKNALSFLSKAHELVPEDATTHFNLGTIYYGIGEDEKALYWLEKIEAKSDQILEWIYQIKETLNLRGNISKWIKFLLLRIENGVERALALKEIANLLVSNEIVVQTVKVNLDVIEDKLSTINMLINHLHEENEWSHILDLLELTLYYQEEKDNTLILLCNLSIRQNHASRAIKYLEMISVEDERVSKLKVNINNLQLAERMRM